MLRLVETRAEKISAQRRFAKEIERAWGTRERRTVAWRPSRKELPIAHNGHLWFAQIRPHDDQQTLRYWNSFGVYDAVGNLQIAVEINIPIDSNTRRVSGFFAKDDSTGAVYLMHDGGVGGGRRGIGQENFLRWSSKHPVPVMASDGSERFGIIVSGLDDESLSVNISSFVQSVIDFKAAIVSGEPLAVETERGRGSYQSYFKEYSGQKKGNRKKEFEYITRHGDIVHALSEWVLRSRIKKDKLRVVKNAFIDLGLVDKEGKLCELYEVKTNSSRQTLYTAVGQLMVHQASADGGVKKYVVLPKGDAVSDDIRKAFTAMGIQMLFFTLRKRSILIE
ncbi:hypothetical protein [Metapseudomonas otitidis]|uniref:hypothetical protein n=1 Tax=Metapseudomonas otitidis TaxID=319939 RepID=UPI0013F63EAB|nr:hypothetical protein [Pseudomonas otitidis]